MSGRRDRPTPFAKRSLGVRMFLGIASAYALVIAFVGHHTWWETDVNRLIFIVALVLLGQLAFQALTYFKSHRAGR